MSTDADDSDDDADNDNDERDDEPVPQADHPRQEGDWGSGTGGGKWCYDVSVGLDKALAN